MMKKIEENGSGRLISTRALLELLAFVDFSEWEIDHMIDSLEDQMLEVLKKLSWQDKVTMLNEYRIEHSFSIRGLADELGTSPSKVQRDLYLADGLKAFPELLNERIADNAFKYLKRKKFHRQES